MVGRTDPAAGPHRRRPLTGTKSLRRGLFHHPTKRCVHVGDRESDIYELYCLAQELGTTFLVRVQTDRLAGGEDGPRHDGKVHRVYQKLEIVPWAGRHDIELTDEAGQSERVSLSVKFSLIDTLPPIGKQKSYPPTRLVYIQAAEDHEPEGRPKVDWRLVTNLPVLSLADAVEKLSWYALRWKIEVFHKIMKSGCKAEDSKLRTAERLVKLLAIIAVVSWRVFWITMSSQANPDSSADVAFTPTEIAILDGVVPASRSRRRPPDLAFYANRLARLGGYLDRARDPPPGNIVMWRGIKPAPHLLVLVGGVVVEDDVDQLAGRDVALEGVEEADEFLMPMALHIPSEHRAGEDIERGEQRGGAVALVVVGQGGAAALLLPQSGLGAVEAMNRIASTTSPMSVVRGGPPRRGPATIGAITAHSRSVRSLGKRRRSRLCSRRAISIQAIGNPI